MSYLEMLKALIREREESSRSGDGGQTAESPCGGEKSEGSEERARRRVESRYAFPWPDEIEGIGVRHIQAFSACSNCTVGTWAFYGPWPLCLRCANLGRLDHDLDHRRDHDLDHHPPLPEPDGRHD